MDMREANRPREDRPHDSLADLRPVSLNRPCCDLVPSRFNHDMAGWDFRHAFKLTLPPFTISDERPIRIGQRLSLDDDVSLHSTDGIVASGKRGPFAVNDERGVSFVGIRFHPAERVRSLLASVDQDREWAGEWISHSEAFNQNDRLNSAVLRPPEIFIDFNFNFPSRSPLESSELHILCSAEVDGRNGLSSE